jgi:hypothetical protein
MPWPPWESKIKNHCLHFQYRHEYLLRPCKQWCFLSLFSSFTFEPYRKILGCHTNDGIQFHIFSVWNWRLKKKCFHLNLRSWVKTYELFSCKPFQCFKFVITTGCSYSLDMFKYPAINFPPFLLSVLINYFTISAFLWIVEHFGHPRHTCLLYPL